MTADLGRLRAELVTRIEVSRPAIQAAFASVPRHLFLPGVPPEEVYQDEAIVTKRDAAGVPVSSSSQPAIMAIMLDQLDLTPGHRVLEIGAGTGYNAALMKHIVGASGQVTSIDIDPEVAREAGGHLAAAGYQDVTVTAGDGAQGNAERAPYDRLIATVGVSDLAPAWLSQVTADAVIVVPLDVPGAQLSVAFQREDGHWASRSIAPCGFMRMRGSLAGPAAVVPLGPGLRLQLPAERGLDPAALAAAIAAPPEAAEDTGVSAAAPEVFWSLNLWLAAREDRACQVAEELHADRTPALTGSLVSSGTFHATHGLVTADSIAMLSRRPDSGLIARGYGSGAAALAAALAAQVRAWDAAGRPAASGMHVDAYPRQATDAPAPGTMIVERPSTRFAVYHT